MNTTTIKKASLYERLGKVEGITALVDDIVEAHYVNPIIQGRFLPYKDMPEYPDNVNMVKKHTVDFFCAGSGGPQGYSGRDMPTTHRGMNITEAEYAAAVDDILMCLDKHGRDEETKKDVLAIANSLKDQIIRM